MRKSRKLLFGTATLAAAAAGAYYFYKKLIKDDSKEALEDFDDFNDQYDDYEFEDDDYHNSREYVRINITSDEEETEDEVQQDKEEE